MRWCCSVRSSSGARRSDSRSDAIENLALFALCFSADWDGRSGGAVGDVEEADAAGDSGAGGDTDDADAEEDVESITSFSNRCWK